MLHACGPGLKLFVKMKLTRIVLLVSVSLNIPHRLNLKVSYVLLLAAGTALRKAVAVQLCQLVPGDSRAQM